MKQQEMMVRLCISVCDGYRRVSVLSHNGLHKLAVWVQWPSELQLHGIFFFFPPIFFFFFISSEKLHREED